MFRFGDLFFVFLLFTSSTQLPTFSFRIYRFSDQISQLKIKWTQSLNMNNDLTAQTDQENSASVTNAFNISTPNLNSDNDLGYYISCGSCKSVFLFNTLKDLEQAIGSRGSRVKCSVCDKQWFQGLDKVAKIDKQVTFNTISDQRAEEMKKFILDNNWSRNPRGDKIDLFIGNLPFNFDETDIVDLFAEYGIVGVSLVRDADRQSKGFAFIELSNQADADAAINEMDGFYLDNQRKLVVKLSIRNTPSAGGATRDINAGANDSSSARRQSNSGGTAPATATPVNSGAKSVWVPRNNR